MLQFVNQALLPVFLPFETSDDRGGACVQRYFTLLFIIIISLRCTCVIAKTPPAYQTFHCEWGEARGIRTSTSLVHQKVRQNKT